MNGFRVWKGKEEERGNGMTEMHVGSLVKDGLVMPMVTDTRHRPLFQSRI